MSVYRRPDWVDRVRVHSNCVAKLGINSALCNAYPAILLFYVFFAAMEREAYFSLPSSNSPLEEFLII